ncbi:SDR family oxidoreductase [Oscillatoriales cyanobacterium LEGE 11467]|uniref:SDR family oxidoreductase n=1 Tax=Zarconia navalis LEGE 11467 TaxID=1828826 RepID=A0A928W2V7_9CYAN|nr:SDR family oxidoreductase [Zarconia navalis]MBE9042195.1 SDR family oxidoreductase [Zarconia navalis LEGE 11467]
MKTIVITGSSRGLGYGLADAFLDRGCSVTICGRTADTLEIAERNLVAKYDRDRILAFAGDVRNFDDVGRLWDEAIDRFGKIDIWINNAGIANPRVPVWEQTPDRIAAVVETNLIGTMYGAKVAISRMLEQGYGAVYNLEGAGSGGDKIRYLTLYGTTKYGIRYLTESLVRETQGTPIVVGALSPGIVVTDLLSGQYDLDDPAQARDWEQTKRLLNLLADRVETVAPWLVDRILTNTKTGDRIAWLTPSKAIGRLLVSPFRQRDVFGD